MPVPLRTFLELCLHEVRDASILSMKVTTDALSGELFGEALRPEAVLEELCSTLLSFWIAS